MFSQYGWQPEIIEEKSVYKKIKIIDGEKEQIINLYAGNIRNEKRNPFEKKIQLSTLDPREKIDEFTIILGIYVYNKDDVLKDIIVVGYPIDPNISYETNPSLRGVFVNEALIKGKKRGLYVDHNRRIAVFRPEFIFYYLDNYKTLHRYEGLRSSTESFPYNRIIFGAPGTGKSFRLNQQKTSFADRFERVTFHPSYTYSQFFGSYKPKPKVSVDDNEEYITYEFTMGPFMRLWIQAINNPSMNYLLLIEEINRANVAAVFGDIFQLLDRKDDGSSEYPIATTEDVRNCLINEHKFESDVVDTISIPSNLYIWATMNSADQGVYPMDSAFKRRWHFEYIGIDESEDKIEDIMIKIAPDLEIGWNKLRLRINARLTDADINVNEDKLIGPFFLKREELASQNADIAIKHKLLLYLFDDVLKHRKGKFFNPQYNTLSKIMAAYDNGENIFDFNLTEEIDE